MRPVPLVAVAHGSRDPRSARAVEELFGRVRRLRPGLDVRVAYLDHVAPDPGAAIGALAARGAGEVVVLPALLTAAYHSKVDLPAVLGAVHGAYPWLRVRYGGTLGPHPLLEDAVLRRLADAGVRAAPDTALVLASAGSSDPGANAVIERAAARLAARGPWLRVRAAYASAAAPSPGEAVAALRAGGAPRVAVAGYLLAPGFFADRVSAQSLAAGADAVSPALGAAPELARLVLHRYDEALRGAAEREVPTARR
ncbi:sirohydrochlorin chelatase [Marinitenerispora sediminis]|uniref:Cobalamin biosynthesis protein CbiX n=1 Tax=Marinitenerispora sediminis TaxID=1931232 RepID=A0A368SZU9_9ACTN|nr:sirohydrochlorin chelatase [Marinitenerispora sediminis]RCV51528.1 cobalamin biosynthesis protein CbiX [Marinitenerispora sediminis]RCV52477.1 cobalamin biosynthesis protein CbiX [Marinitenerispora sediminis]RCV62189.1 cobalamin biosynthesis protein CbiX [Marinitenerispora sediminis]